MIVKPHHNVGPHGRCGVFPGHVNAGDYLPNGGRGSDLCMETARRWMSAASEAADLAVIARATELHRTPAVELPGPDVCHTPGGGPLNVPPSEAAPRRTWQPPEPYAACLSDKYRNRVKRARRKMERGSLPVEDVLSMARNAARSAMQGKNFSESDRDDCMMAVVEKILERVPDPAASRYPVRHIGYGWMMQRAANYREHVEGVRAKDARHAADDAGKLASPAARYTLDESRRDLAPGTQDAAPYKARQRAVAMLRQLGTLGDVVQPGPLWTAAYSAARIGVRWDVVKVGRKLEVVAVEAAPDDVADELDITPATYRKHLSRAGDRVPAADRGRYLWHTLPTDAGHRAAAAAGTAPHGQPGSPRAVLDYIARVERAAGDEPTETMRPTLHAVYVAMDLPTDDAGTAKKPSRTRSAAANVGLPGTSSRKDGWRGLDAARPAAGPTTSAWGKTRDKRRKLVQPAWAKDLRALRPRRADKLDAMAARNARTVAARTGDERDAMRAAAGLPPVPAARRTP